MKSLYAEYIKEIAGRETIETADYFVTFKIEKEYCFIADMYIVPEKRQKNMSFMITDKVAEIAKERGCKYLTCTVSDKQNNGNNLFAILKYGFRINSAENHLIYFIKDI